jgi:DNA-binding transcriptional ArsR family regulator
MKNPYPSLDENLSEVLVVARHYEHHLKEFGQPNGPLGYIALEILEVLIGENFTSGLLTYGFLQEKTKRSKSAISRALKNLCEHGFLEKLVKKSTYALILPEAAVQIFRQELK